MGRLAVLALLGGLAAGAAVGGTARAVETSRIAFGPYALYGNGALAVPAVLAPVAIFAGWTWLRRRSARAFGEMTLFALALLFGTGMGYGALMGQPLAMLSGLLGFGLFVAPTALLAALTIWLLHARRLTSTAALTTAFLGGIVLAALPPFAFIGGLGATGISAGAGVVATGRASAAAAFVVGIALAFLVIVQVFALPLLVGPVFAGR